jgi:hypothetical protein
MKTGAVAKKLVDLCRKGKFTDAMEKLYSDKIVSVEAMDMPGMPRQMKTLAAVRKKTEWWEANNEVISAKIMGPFVAVDKFAVVFDMETKDKKTKKKQKMVEVAVYTVENGKIVHEEFLYHAE